MQKKPNVKAGDIVGILLGDETFVAGIVLHVSKVFKGGIIIGFYDKVFKSMEDIDINELGGKFIDTPNYVVKEMITRGVWRYLENNAELLTKSNIPELRVAYHIYHKDMIIRSVTVNEFKNYTELEMAGGGFIENKLKKHFDKMLRGKE